MAVCKRELSGEFQRRLGDQKEIWRYKSSIPVNPREQALSGLDPFSDPATVKPISPQKKPCDPFALDVNFEEVDPDILDAQHWHECFAIHMTHPEHITLK